MIRHRAAGLILLLPACALGLSRDEAKTNLQRAEASGNRVAIDHAYDDYVKSAHDYYQSLAPVPVGAEAFRQSQEAIRRAAQLQDEYMKEVSAFMARQDALRAARDRAALVNGRVEFRKRVHNRASILPTPRFSTFESELAWYAQQADAPASSFGEFNPDGQAFDAFARYRVAFMCVIGWGTPVDEVRARKYAERADQSWPEVQGLLAYLIASNPRDEADAKRGVALAKAAVPSGDAFASLALGMFLCTGRGVAARDPAEGFFYICQSSGRVFEHEYRFLGSYLSGHLDDIPPAMTLYFQTKADRKWEYPPDFLILKAAQFAHDGDPLACLAIFINTSDPALTGHSSWDTYHATEAEKEKSSLINAEWFKPNRSGEFSTQADPALLVARMKEALPMLRKSAADGDVRSIQALSRIYRGEWGGKPNRSALETHARVGLMQGWAADAEFIASRYEGGLDGWPKDPAAAVEWRKLIAAAVEEAAGKGNPIPVAWLANKVASESATGKPDYERAKALVHSALDRATGPNLDPAIAQLLASTPAGPFEDDELALAWLRKGASLGRFDAALALAQFEISHSDFARGIPDGYAAVKLASNLRELQQSTDFLADTRRRNDEIQKGVAEYQRKEREQAAVKTRAKMEQVKLAAIENTARRPEVEAELKGLPVQAAGFDGTVTFSNAPEYSNPALELLGTEGVKLIPGLLTMSELAAHGNADAAYTLARLYAHGPTEVPSMWVDLGVSRAWCDVCRVFAQRSADAGDARGAVILAMLAANPDHLPYLRADDAEYLTAAHRAVSLGDTNMAFQLADFYGDAAHPDAILAARYKKVADYLNSHVRGDAATPEQIAHVKQLLSREAGQSKESKKF